MRVAVSDEPWVPLHGGDRTDVRLARFLLRVVIGAMVRRI